ncbi:MAG: hypothetical protein ACLP9S_11990 [Syntrophales bacterium]|jgi:hypothetical protein
MAGLMAEMAKKHKINKENPFIATVTWGPGDDVEAARRLKQIHNALEEKCGIKDGFAWYLVGKRTMIVFGFTDDSMNIEKFSLFMTQGTNIKVEPCYVVEAHELVEVIKDKFK